MSEYTPTTEDVRAGWMASGPLASTVVRAIEFERWLAAEKAKAWNEGHEACALRIPEGVWADTAARHPGNPYQKGSDDE